MAQVQSKKESRKTSKGSVAPSSKGKVTVKAAQPKTKAPVPSKASTKAVKVAKVTQEEVDEEEEVDENESDWSSEDDSYEDEDEDNGDVTEEGMKRLMQLVEEGDLDEEDLQRLAALGTSDDEEEEEGDDDDGEEEEAGSDEEGEVDGEIPGESDEDDEDEESHDEDAAVNNKIIINAPDADELPLDDIASDVSVDEDAVPMRKVLINNGPALRAMTEKINVTSLPFVEHLVVSSRTILDVDPSDDLQREMAFYKIALESLPLARKLSLKSNIPFTRPTDYYAEMVKSDEHMERVRTKLVEESQGIKKSEAAKKQRDLKKYGKQIQVEKLKQREMDKKGFQDKMQGIKRKRKDGMDLGEDGGDDFGVSVEDAMLDGDDRSGGRGSSGRGRGRGGGRDTKMPRTARDAKYSLGGGSRRSKQNTKESTNDFGGWSGGGGGNSGGSRGGRGGRGGKARGGGGSSRPGKSKRAGGRR